MQHYSSVTLHVSPKNRISEEKLKITSTKIQILPRNFFPEWFGPKTIEAIHFWNEFYDKSAQTDCSKDMWIPILKGLKHMNPVISCVPCSNILNIPNFTPTYFFLNLGGNKFYKVYLYSTVNMGQLTIALLFVKRLPKKYKQLQQKAMAGGSSRTLPGWHCDSLSAEPFLTSSSIETSYKSISPVWLHGQSGLVNTCCPSHSLGKYSLFLPQFLFWSKSHQFVNMEESWGERSRELRLKSIIYRICKVRQLYNSYSDCFNYANYICKSNICLVWKLLDYENKTKVICANLLAFDCDLYLDFLGSFRFCEISVLVSFLF